MAEKETIINRIYKDFRYSYSKMKKLHEAIKDDFIFEQGKQWEDSDIETLRKAGVKALTINKIKPIIKLITGLERQSRSDFKGLPEGEEDELTSEIVSMLLKNVSKNSRIETKFSDQFKHGSIGGMCFLEPYIDYSFDLINGDLKWKKISALDVFLDPDFQEYDLSDSKFLIKVTRDLKKDDLLLLFPDDKNKIEKITNGRVPWDWFNNPDAHLQPLGYNDSLADKTDVNDNAEPGFDLIDYYYKSVRPVYSVANAELGLIKDFYKEDEAKTVAAQTNGTIIKRNVPVIMQAQCVGDTIFYDDICEFYPRWKLYPLIPYFAELISEKLKDFDLRIVGIVRGIKDLNEEFNKRRTQELRHLNASANSGFDVEEGQLSEDELAKLKKYGSSPGFVVQRKRGTPPISRITPMPLSQGHAQLAEENAQDLKEASGVNPDLLANDSQSQSGRAILFKQRQGMVMVQEMLDNFAETKRLAGRFILSQLKELFTVESAMRVLGDSFIRDNFTVPVSIILDRGLQKMNEGKDDEISNLERATLLNYSAVPVGQPILDEQSNLVTVVDFDTAIQTIDNILNNAEINKYDVEIGEGPYQDTIRMANFMDMKELATQGVPIPPTTLIELSMIPSNEKKKILQQLQMQQMAMAQAAQAKPSPQGEQQ